MGSVVGGRIVKCVARPRAEAEPGANVTVGKPCQKAIMGFCEIEVMFMEWNPGMEWKMEYGIWGVFGIEWNADGGRLSW